jgi:hypothetical protein
VTTTAREAGAEPVLDRSQRPYAPSWIDYFTTWVDRLPGSVWLYYIGLALLLVLIPSVILWAEGSLPIGSFLPSLVFLNAGIAFFLALFRYFDERASAALLTLRPILDANDEEQLELHYRLTNLPALPTLVASFAVLIFVFASEAIGDVYRLDILDRSPVSAGVLRLAYLLSWWVFGAFLYRTFHQLRMINLIFTHHTHVNLFRMKPLHAFGNLSALTAVCVAAIPYGFILISPGVSLSDPNVLLATVPIFLFALGVFLWPQLGIHSLQIAEKGQRIDQANQRLEAVIEELHRRVDGDELDKIGELQTTIATLDMELGSLRRIPTWPWEPETLRWLIGALVLPLGLWLVQYIFQHVLSP